MGSNELIGKAAVPMVAPEEHRGGHEHTKEEMARMFPTIHIKGEHAAVRAKRPHDFRNNSSDPVQRWLCNLDGLDRHDPIHRL